MTVDEIRKEVAEVAKTGEQDDEGAHVAEDNLHQNVLAAIAEGKCDDPAACAAAALETLKLDFNRWYA